MVRVPRIEGEQAPVVRAQRRRLGERIGEDRADRPGRVHAEGEHFAVADRVDFAGQARHLLPLRREQDHRRIAADLEARTDLLRARAVAVDVDRNEGARALDEVPAVEERRLDLVARRAPLRAPVHEDRLVLVARTGERGVDLAVVGSVAPGDARLRMLAAGSLGRVGRGALCVGAGGRRRRRRRRRGRRCRRRGSGGRGRGPVAASQRDRCGDRSERERRERRSGAHRVHRVSSARHHGPISRPALAPRAPGRVATR